MKLVKLKKIKKIQNKSLRYDIETKKTHNFFANNILVHNSSFTAYYNNDQFGICSRNLDLFETEDNTHWRVARELKLEEKMKAYGKNIALQGELLGEGIQKNKYKLKGQNVYFFNVFNIDTYKYFGFNEFLNILSQFELKCVPMLHIEGFKLLPTMEEMIKFAEGKSALNVNQEREGIVIRPKKEIEHPKYGRISFKIISNKYLLKYEE